jgi:hypothetical protein
VTIKSSDVANEICEGSLVFLKSCIRILSDLNWLASISMFSFTCSRLGFGPSSCGDGGFGFSPSVDSLLFK